MKAFKLLLIVVMTAWVVSWMKHGYDFPLGSCLPFASGKPLSIYDVAGLGMIAWAVRAAGQIRRGA